jgi:hypothetical protein
MKPDIEQYFAALHARRHTARKLRYRSVAESDWTPQPAQCHANVDHMVRSHPALKAVRGWLIRATDGNEGRNYAAHSVIEDHGELFDITLQSQEECDHYPFIEHVGPEDEFWTVVTICCEKWYPIPDLQAALSEGADGGFEDGY